MDSEDEGDEDEAQLLEDKGVESEIYNPRAPRASSPADEIGTLRNSAYATRAPNDNGNRSTRRMEHQVSGTMDKISEVISSFKESKAPPPTLSMVDMLKEHEALLSAKSQGFITEDEFDALSADVKKRYKPQVAPAVVHNKFKGKSKGN